MYAIDRIHKKILYSQEFQHHGIEGQRWGVITRNVGVNYIPIGKRDSMLKNATAYNLDSWGKSASTNVLYITGYSGSGKSSLAVAMQGPKVDVIHLDSYFDNPDGPRNKRFNAHLKKTCPEYTELSLSKGKLSMNELVKIIIKFEKEIENFGKAEFADSQKVICEGVQLLDNTIQPDKSFFRDKPMIIMNTGAITSAYRSAMRDEIPLSPKLIARDIKNYSASHKDIQNIRKIFS